MQENHVVGIGNAIVDIIARCDDAFLERHGRALDGGIFYLRPSVRTGQSGCRGGARGEQIPSSHSFHEEFNLSFLVIPGDCPPEGRWETLLIFWPARRPGPVQHRSQDGLNFGEESLVRRLLHPFHIPADFIRAGATGNRGVDPLLSQ